MSVHRLTPAEKAQRQRRQAVAKVRSCGLPWDHPALVFAVALLLGARSAYTAVTYANGLCRWFRYCLANGIDPFAATRMDARAYAAALPDEGLKPSSQATCCAAPRTFYEEAIAERKLQFNPFKRVGPADRSASRPTPALTLEQVCNALRICASILAKPGANLVRYRNFALLYLGVRLGLRRSEYTNLTWADRGNDFGRSRIQITGKGASENDPIVPADLDVVLDVWRRALEAAIGRPVRGDDPLFPIIGNGDHYLRSLDLTAPLPALAPPGVVYAIKMLLRDAGIVGPGIASHVLRATSATLAWKGGADRLDIVALLRHKTADMTDHYIRRATEVTAADSWLPEDLPALAAFKSRPRRRRTPRKAA